MVMMYGLYVPNHAPHDFQHGLETVFRQEIALSTVFRVLHETTNFRQEILVLPSPRF